MIAQPELFNAQEWQRLDPALQVLGDVGALNAMVEGGAKILAEWDSMSLTDQQAASAMIDKWPREEVDPEWPPIPAELTERIEGYGTPRFIASEHVRECRQRLERLHEWQRYQDTAALEADIQALIDGNYISDRQVALDWLNEGFTLKSMREMGDIASDNREVATIKE